MNNNNLFYAIILSALILFGYYQFFQKPQAEAYRVWAAAQKAAQVDKDKRGEPKPEESLRPRAEIIAGGVQSGLRVKIATPTLHGSVNLVGARLDDLTLVQHHETVDPASPEIVLLSPSGAKEPHRAYYGEFGWLGEGQGLAVPTAQTQWKASQGDLSPASPLILTWDNGQGQIFSRKIEVDENYMFTVTDSVRNTGAQPVTLHPYGLVLRHGEPGASESGASHVGPVGVFDGTLKEFSYKDVISDLAIMREGTGGWLGLSDKYWLVALVPPAGEKITGQFKYARATDAASVGKPELGKFQTDFRGEAVTVAPGADVEHVTRFFAGAKQVRLLDAYSERDNIAHFDRAIDFGWFYFLTKPLLYLLDWLGSHLGNFGVAILVLTVIVKLLVLPLGVRSFRSMAKLKKLQPEMQRIMQRFKEDRARQSVEVMELYRREKVSPMSGCVPILLQIPVFFALYKVLSIGIEMRHAPFFGWIHDLSAPDPTSFVNLFGLLPWGSPSFLHLGVWPLLMGGSMFLQQKLSPQPADPAQAKVMMAMPVIFTLMLGPTMASGLIIYWTWSNLLSIAQQMLIYRNMGVKAT